MSQTAALTAVQLATILEHLRGIGLSFESAYAYLAILKLGPARVEQIVEQTDLGTAQVTEVLQWLLLANLCAQDIDNRMRRPTYYILSPEIAFRAYGLRADWARPASFPPPSPGFVTDLTPERSERIRMHAESLLHLVSVSRSKTRQPQSLKLGRSPAAMAWLLAEAIGQANDHVWLTSAPRHLPHTSLIVASIMSAIARGVRVRRICAVESIASLGLEITKKDIEERRIDLRLVEEERITHKFYVIDERVVAVFHPGASAEPHLFRNDGPRCP